MTATMKLVIAGWLPLKSSKIIGVLRCDTRSEVKLRPSRIGRSTAIFPIRDYGSALIMAGHWKMRSDDSPIAKSREPSPARLLGFNRGRDQAIPRQEAFSTLQVLWPRKASRDKD